MHHLWIAILVALLVAPDAVGQFNTDVPKAGPPIKPELERFAESANLFARLPIPEPVRIALRGTPEVLREVNQFQPNGDELLHSWRAAHTYTSAGHLRHLSTHFAHQGDPEPSPLYRSIRNYDAEARLSEMALEWHDGTAFQPWLRSVYSYSGSAIVPSVVVYQWNDGQGFHDYQRELYTVSGDGTYYTGVQVDFWDDAWLPYYRFVLENVVGGVAYMIQGWTGSEWYNDSRAIVSDLTIPELVALLAHLSEMEEDMLGVYLAMALVPDHVVEVWSGDGWVPEDRQTSVVFTHPQSGALLRVESTLEEYTGAGWEAFGRMVRSYDLNPDELLDLLEFQYPDGAEWDTILTETYSYTENDRFAEVEIAVSPDFNARGRELELAVLITYDWGEPTVGTEVPGLDVAFGIESVYPNPLAAAGVVRFVLDAASDVKIELFDVLGRRVATVLDGHLVAGVHEARFEASGWSAGTYIVRLDVGGRSETRAFTIVR